MHTRWAVVMCCRMGHFGRVPSEGRRFHPAPRRHSEARCNQWKHHRIKKNADAALQAAQTVLALYSEATRREMITLAPHPYNGVHCTHLHVGTSAAPQWGKRGIWG